MPGIFDTILGAVTGLGNLGVGLYSAISGNQNANKNIDTQKEIADSNLDMQKEAQDWQRITDDRNFDYMQAVQQNEWSRADTMHQREVADLRAAGLSPIAAGNGNVTGQVVSQNQAPSPVIPQYDGSGIANAMSAALTSKQQSLGIMSDALANIYNQSSENVRSSQRNELESDITNRELQTRFDIVRAQIQSNEAIESEKQRNDIVKHLDNLELQNKILDEQIRHNTRQEALVGQQFILDNCKSITGYGNFKFYDNLKSYETAIREWNSLYAEFQKNNLHLLGSVSQSSSTSSSQSDSAGVSGGIAVIKGGSDISTSRSQSSSNSDSWDYSKEYYAKEKAFMMKNPFPFLR